MAPGTLRSRLYPIVSALLLALASSTSAQTGAELLKPFKKNLMGALQQGLGAGVVPAIGACNEQAPGIAAALSVDGVRLGRSSQVYR